jgi:hypothetical protein
LDFDIELLEVRKCWGEDIVVREISTTKGHKGIRIKLFGTFVVGEVSTTKEQRGTKEFGLKLSIDI